MREDAEEQWVEVAEAADLLGVDADTVAGLVARGFVYGLHRGTDGVLIVWRGGPFARWQANPAGLRAFLEENRL